MYTVACTMQLWLTSDAIPLGRLEWGCTRTKSGSATDAHKLDCTCTLNTLNRPSGLKYVHPASCRGRSEGAPNVFIDSIQSVTTIVVSTSCTLKYIHTLMYLYKFSIPCKHLPTEVYQWEVDC